MKNKHIEQLKRCAKLYLRTNHAQSFQNGIAVRHCYDEAHPEQVSWWDDVAFVLNDYIVNVAWQHPRCAYKDRAEELAYDTCSHLLQEPCSLNFIDKANPIYRKIGKSRKKIVSYTMNHKRDDGYYDTLHKEEIRIARDPNNGIVVSHQA